MASPADLRRGVRGAAGTRIRFRRPSDDSELLRRLCREAVGEDMPADHYLLTEDTSAALEAGARGGPAAILELVTGRTQFEIHRDYSAVIVAESNQGVIGAIFLAPPVQLLDLPGPAAVRGIMAVTKLTAVTVLSGHRGLGVGASLVKQAVAACRACNIAIMYGEFDGQNSDLTRFYSDRGFELFDHDDVVDLTSILGTPYYVREGDARARLFARRISSAYPFPIRRTGGAPHDPGYRA